MHDTTRTPLEWRSVPGYEGLYEASDLGDIRSLDHEVPSRGGTRMVRGRLLKQHPRQDDYLQVQLYCNGAGRWFTVHTVIASTFHGPRPDGCEVRHGDGNGSNNAASNLSYTTHDENIRDQLRHGTHAQANKSHCIHGHEWTPANTYRHPQLGHRLCRRCRATWKAAARQDARATA